MKRVLTLFVLASAVTCAAQAGSPAIPPAPNGMAFPADYADWQVISISHRVDNNTLRVILGNPVAVEAARAGRTNPWPDGSMLGKVVWKETAKPTWKKAIVPDRFVHAEFMHKDSKRWAGNGTGWGWARWVGAGYEPYGKDASVGQECIACHTPVKGNDWVFTTPAAFPGAD